MTTNESLLKQFWALKTQLGLLAKRSKGQGVQGIAGRDRIIMTIAHHGPDLSQRELADLVHLRPGSLTEALNNLEGEGFVQRRRDEEDRRIVRVALTAKAQTRLAELAAGRKRFENQLFAGISETDKETLARVLTQMAANVRQVAEKKGKGDAKS